MEKATIAAVAWAPVTAAVLVTANPWFTLGLAALAFMTTVIMYSPSKKKTPSDG